MTTSEDETGTRSVLQPPAWAVLVVVGIGCLIFTWVAAWSTFFGGATMRPLAPLWVLTLGSVVGVIELVWGVKLLDRAKKREGRTDD